MLAKAEAGVLDHRFASFVSKDFKVVDHICTMLKSNGIFKFVHHRVVSVLAEMEIKSFAIDGTRRCNFDAFHS